MAEPPIVECPRCATTLRPKTAVAAGKKIRCPKCAEVFAPTPAGSRPDVPAPAKTEPRPARRRSRGTRPAQAAAKAPGRRKAGPTAKRGRKPPPPRGGRSAPLRTSRRTAPVEDIEDYGDVGDFDDLNDFDDFGDEIGFDEDHGEELEGSYGAAVPRRGARRGRTKKKRKASGKRGTKWVLPLVLILCGLLGMGVIGGGVYLAVTTFGGRNFMDFTYMPADLEAVIYIDVGALAKSDLLGDAFDNPMLAAAAQQWQQQVGLDVQPSDIADVTIGMWDIPQTQGPSFVMGRRQSPDHLLAVVRFARALDLEQATPGSLGESTQYEGETYYRFINSGETVAMWMPETDVLVAGKEQYVKDAISRGKSEQRQSQFDFMDSSQHVLFAVAPKRVRSTGQPSVPGNPSQQLEASMNNNVEAVSFGASVTSEVRIAVRAQCHDSERATQLKGDLDELLARVRTTAQSAPAGAMPGMPFGGQSIDDVMNAVHVSQSGATVDVNLTLPRTVTDDLKSLMGNGSGGPPAGLPGNPPFSPTR